MDDADALTDLTGLASLVSANTLSLVDNGAIAELSGLDALCTVSARTIQGNASLPTCLAYELLDRLEACGGLPSSTIANNNTTAFCDEREIVVSNAGTHQGGWLVVNEAYVW